MQVVFTRSAEEFAARAGALLGAGRDTNLHATVLAGARASTAPIPGALYATVEEDGEVVALALRTPPWPLIASALAEGAAMALMEGWLREDPEVCGVVAPAPAATHVAVAFESLGGGRALLAVEEAAHSLTRVREPARPASGSLRCGVEDDHALLVDWSVAFAREADEDYGDASAIVARRLRKGGLWLWVDSQPVCMVGVNDEVSGVVRLGPVYTPPEHRRRGYATSAVAAASAAALARGAHTCMLFTDLANPTSNRIYAALGYERFADWRQYRFEAP